MGARQVAGASWNHLFPVDVFRRNIAGPRPLKLRGRATLASHYQFWGAARRLATYGRQLCAPGRRDQD